jgi:glutamate/tyrosine decarboxylase-like PLP-dependent enzyme
MSEGLHFIEPDGSNRDAVRRLGYRFIDLVVEAAGSAASRPPVPQAHESVEAWTEPYAPPSRGKPPHELLRVLKEQVIDRVLNPAHPGYVGHMDTLASTIGIFSDLIVSACNNNMLSYEMSLAFTRMEQAVLRWATKGFGWDEKACGYLVGGGTLANIQAVWTARNAHDRRIAQRGLLGAAAAPGAASARPVLIASEHAHYSFAKAANLLGIGREGLLLVPTGADGLLDPADVEEMITHARRDGMEPFCIVGIAGTTVGGRIEPLESIAVVARRHKIWFHVDAAYGGSLIVSPGLRERLRGCELADSITWNPQKWVYVPKTCAAVLYRDSSLLDETIRQPFPYGYGDDDPERPNLGEYTIQGTRRVDVLKLWLTLEHLGTDVLGRLIEQSIESAQWFAEQIRESADLELVTPPDLSIVCFRAAPAGVDRGDRTAMNRVQARIHREVARRGHSWLSLPTYQGKRVLRAVILHPRCSTERLGRLLDDIREAMRQAG